MKKTDLQVSKPLKARDTGTVTKIKKGSGTEGRNDFKTVKGGRIRATGRYTSESKRRERQRKNERRRVMLAKYSSQEKRQKRGRG